MPPPRIHPISLLGRFRTLRPFLRASPFRNPTFAHAQSALPWYSRALFKYALILAGAHLFTTNLYSVASTQGPSMYPTIPASGRGFQAPLVLISRLYKRGAGIKVGDIIVFDVPMSQSHGCKRVIGMPGDLVCVQTPASGGEDDFAEGSLLKEEMIRVPEGHCWVVGDNLDFSRDSRVWGPLPLNLVRGRVLALVAPWDQATWFTDDLAWGSPAVAEKGRVPVQAKS